jgi:hypothetical protein
MKPEAPDTAAHTASDFEQLESNRPNGRRRQARSGEDIAPKVREEQQGETMQLQADRVRAEAMTAEAIRVDVKFEFLDPILGRPAVVIPGDEIDGAPAPVRDHEADVKPLGGDINLDKNAAATGPGFRSMPEAGAHVPGAASPIVPPLRLRDEPGDPGLEDTIRAEAELLIEFSNEQQPRIRRERAAGKIDDEFRLESEPKLAITLCSHRTSSVGIPSRPKSPRKYHDCFEGDGVFTYSFVNYPG